MENVMSVLMEDIILIVRMIVFHVQLDLKIVNQIHVQLHYQDAWIVLMVGFIWMQMVNVKLVI